MLQKLRSTHCGRPAVEEDAEEESATPQPPPVAAASPIGNSSLVTIDPESNPPRPPPSLLVSSEGASFRFFRMPNSNSSKPPPPAADWVELEPSLLYDPSALTTDDSDVAADSSPSGPAPSTFSPSFSATAPSPSTWGTDSSKTGGEETLRSSILADKITLFRSHRLDEEEPEEVEVSATQSRRAPTQHLDPNLPTQASTHNTTKDLSFPTPSPQPAPPRTSSSQANTKNQHLPTAYTLHSRKTPGAASEKLSVETYTESTQHNKDRRTSTDHHEKGDGRQQQEGVDGEEGEIDEEEEGRGKKVERMGRVRKTTVCVCRC